MMSFSSLLGMDAESAAHCDTLTHTTAQRLSQSNFKLDAIHQRRVVFYADFRGLSNDWNV